MLPRFYSKQVLIHMSKICMEITSLIAFSRHTMVMLRTAAPTTHFAIKLNTGIWKRKLTSNRSKTFSSFFQMMTSVRNSLFKGTAMRLEDLRLWVYGSHAFNTVVVRSMV